MKTAWTVAAILGAAALGLTACGGSASPGGSGAGGGTLVNGATFTMAIGTDPGTLDPDMTVLSAAIGVDQFLYSPLINLTQDGKPMAGLAQSWQATTTTASFILRSGITCSDGSPVTASDVAANINFVADPNNKSPLAGLFVMPGATAGADNATRTVTVHSAPDAFLLRDLGTLPIVCGKGLTDRSVLAKGGDGTGMFTMTQAVPDDHYTLTRRKDYTWGPGNWSANQQGLPDTVVIKIVQNETTDANLLLSGQLNAATIVGSDQQRLFARGLFHADVLAPLGELFFNENTGHPGQDPAVRKALVQALDLNQIGKVLTTGTGKPAQGMVTLAPKACSGNTVAGNLPSHNVSAAKSALDKAGWTAGPNGTRSKNGKPLSLTVIYPTQEGPTLSAGAELIQQTWKSLGIDVTLKGVDSPGANQVLFGTGAWDVSMIPVGVPLPNELVPFVSGPTPPNGTNFAHIDNTQYNSLAKRASSMASDTGCATWNQAESALIKDADAAPYYDSVAPTFGVKTRFSLSQGEIVPSSIRMYAQ